MDLVQLRTFAEVARLGSISATAASLGYSQSAVSRQLQALETDLSAALLHRGARGVRLSAAGAALLPHAQDMLRSAELARAEVAEAEPEGVRLRIGCIPSATPALLAPALAGVETSASDLTVTVRQAPGRVLIAAVAARELDAAVVMGSGADRPGLLREPLATDELRVVLPAGHPLAGRTRIELAQLAEATWIEGEWRSERILVEAAAQSGFVPTRVRRAPDHAAKLGYVAAGLGVALVPGLLCAALPPGLVAVRLTAAPGRELAWLTRRDHPGGPQLELLRRVLGEVADRLQPARTPGTPDPTRCAHSEHAPGSLRFAGADG
ncbi:LysR family transcriptional regulator [Naumannella sp. ID2617S]|nr:LysR family transcriptional regulator [Naumannella sp. ID2617S]